MDLPNTHDNALVERFRAGDPAAFEEIVLIYRPCVLQLANTKLRDRRDAEEITQDAFIRARNGIHGFRGDCPLKSWLCQIATNLAINRYWYWRRRFRHQHFDIDGPVSDAAGMGIKISDILPNGENPSDLSRHKELEDALIGSLYRLPKSHRRILTLRCVKNLTYSEIAKTMGIGVGTVKSRLNRARERLRRMVNPKLDTPIKKQRMSPRSQ